MKKSKGSRWVDLGEVGVDSGQLLITDPCYIDSEWQKKEFKNIRVYKDKDTDQRFQYGKHFSNFEEPMEGYGGKTPNALILEQQWVQAEVPEKEELIGDYSYAGCCETTIKGKSQLRYRMGHAGAGVVFNSGLGDGTYSVRALVDDIPNWGERVVKVEIELITPENLEMMNKIF